MSHDWTTRAICASVMAPSMFPSDADTPAIVAAKEQCEFCPVRRECLDEAMARGEQYGVWGGLTADERRLLRRRGSRKEKKVHTAQLEAAASTLDTSPPVRQMASVFRTEDTNYAAENLFVTKLRGVPIETVTMTGAVL